MERRGRGFDHEGLEVFQLGLELVERVDRFAPGFRGLRKHLSWQLHRAACSVPLNIAEGNGRYGRKDKARFLVIATGSALECAAIMAVADRLGIGSERDRQAIRDLLRSIVRMLITMTRNLREKSGDRNPDTGAKSQESGAARKVSRAASGKARS